MVTKKYLAEVIGTFVLTIVVALALAGTFPVAVPVLAALTLLLFVYTVGHVSGTHINPAVTLGVWSIQKISTDDAVKYVIAQCVGAGAALMLLPSLVTTGATMVMKDDLFIGVAEMIGTAIFTFGVAAVIYGKVPAVMSGVVIVGSLLLGIAVAALLGANGVLNPAVALGIGSFNIMYVVGPVLGSVLGMQLYKQVAA